MPDLNNVRVSVQGFAELNGSQINVSVRRDEIRGLIVKFGRQSEHPLRQIAFGIVLTGLGVFPIYHLLAAAEPVVSVLELTMLVFLIVGGWVIFSALRSGWYLEVELETDSRKLAFTPRPTDIELEEFLVEAAALGYEIERRKAS